MLFSAATTDESDNLIRVRRLSATEVSRRFSQVLDEVEASGEPVLVVRRGRPVVQIAPAVAANGARVRELLTASTVDHGWARELEDLRSETGSPPAPWTD